MSAVAEHDAGPGRTLLRTDLPVGGPDALRGAVGHLCEIRVVAVDDDGLDAWRDHAEVIVAGDRVVVRPPWVSLDIVRLPDDPIVLKIDPGRSFGHGAHPTTRLCLAEVERASIDRVGMSVLDVGCGSGVLGIAAARLGAAAVWCCDVDPIAVDATNANAVRNGVDDRVTAALADDPDTPLSDAAVGPHDLVVANIGAATLRALAADLIAATASEGTLVVSGLLDDAVDDVVSAFEPWRPVRVEVIDGWAVIVLRSPSTATPRSRSEE